MGKQCCFVLTSSLCCYVIKIIQMEIQLSEFLIEMNLITNWQIRKKLLKSMYKLNYIGH